LRLSAAQSLVETVQNPNPLIFFHEDCWLLNSLFILYMIVSTVDNYDANLLFFGFIFI